MWGYDEWPAIEPQWASGGPKNKWDELDFHVDLGCGRLKKARIGVDRFPDPGVNVLMDLEALRVLGAAEQPGEDATFGRVVPGTGLPFEDSSIRSIVSHHFLEHLGAGFIPLVDEVYRVLVPGGIFRAITPLFPSRAAVDDPDHKRFFTQTTWMSFCGESREGGCWYESFSTPYMNARFKMVDRWTSPPIAPEDRWTERDHQEIRVALEAVK